MRLKFINTPSDDVTSIVVLKCFTFCLPLSIDANEFFPNWRLHKMVGSTKSPHFPSSSSYTQNKQERLTSCLGRWQNMRRHRRSNRGMRSSEEWCLSPAPSRVFHRACASHRIPSTRMRKHRVRAETEGRKTTEMKCTRMHKKKEAKITYTHESSIQRTEKKEK